MPDFVTEAYYDFMNYTDSDTVLAYLGMVDNQPVAISQLVFGAGVAGIYSVATLPEVRRQGIGAYMTLVPLLEAKVQGYEIGILHASELGMGLLFLNTLYDENASNHLALGKAYRFTLEGGEEMLDEAFADAGGNDSLTHVDFMFGSGEIDVDGLLPDGTKEPVMRGGEWANEI